MLYLTQNLTNVFALSYAEFDECSSSPCLNGGTCTDGVYNFTCSCPSPYFGDKCQGHALSFLQGRPSLIYSCFKFSPRVHGLKTNLLTNNGFRSHLETDECQSNPCQNGGTCVDGVYSFTCSCPSSFAGPRCEGVKYDFICYIYLPQCPFHKIYIMSTLFKYVISASVFF